MKILIKSKIIYKKISLKFFIINNQEYIKLLKEKLIEEGIEIIKDNTLEDLCEEIGDVYTILKNIETKELFLS